MVLDKLGEGLKATLRKIAKAFKVDDTLISELVRDIQRALIQADVNVKLVLELSEKIKQRALKEKPPTGLTKKEHLINIVYEELTNFLGKEPKEIKITEKPFKIMLVGLFGSGKTTTIAKLSKYFMKRGYKVATLGLDVHRPAAPEQLEQLSKQINVRCFVDKEEKDPIKIYKKFENDLNQFDIVIIDTAGRDKLSADLMKEIKNLYDAVKPHEVFLVIAADIGQAAYEQAKAFHEQTPLTGIIVTRLDGTAKGGGALTACAATGAKIVFIGTGEKIDDIESFNPKGFVGRLLGMGDIEALLEKAKEAISEEKAKNLSERLLSGEFSLKDLYDQMVALRKMGPLTKLIQMIPGFGQLQLPKELIQVQEEKLKKWKIAMDSMTKEELENPEVIDQSRIKRISRGSGIDEKDIRELIKHYKLAKKLMKRFKGKEGMKKLMKRFGGKLPPGFGF
ncbi:signal recognition particle protein [Candidatus Woesearchaeota archaeon]|nr:MAG: signal recognition particle protein [Candidatus Woesearchaeota archaeon]